MAKSKPNISPPIRNAWRASRRGLAAVVVFTVFINVLRFATPLYLLQILDRIPASRSIETLILLTIIAVLAVSAGVALEALRRRMLTQWGAWIEREFGPMLFLQGASIQSQGQSAPASESLNDLSKLRSFVSKSAAPWLDVLWAPLFVVGVYLVHPLLGAIGLAAIVGLLAIGVLQEVITRAPRRSSRNASSDAQEIVSAVERNTETVGALSMARNFAERWRRSTTAGHDERDRSDAVVATFAAIIQGLRRCVYICMLGVGIYLFVEDALTLGGVFAARIMMSFGFDLVRRAAQNWRTFRDAVGAYQRIKIQLAKEGPDSPSVPDSLLSAPFVIDKITFRYPNQRDPVIRRIDATVAPGQVLIVIGAAGTGKTTLSRLITGVLEPRYGQIRFGDVEIRRLPLDMLSKLLGYLPQEVRLFKGTVRDNIARMGGGNFKDVVEAARLANIHDTIVRLPQGYDSVITEEAVGLSGSERKRIAFARAIYKWPRLIVLDEPEANLDRHSRLAMLAAVEELKTRGSTVVITTQSMTTQSRKLGRISDKVLLLGGGLAESSKGSSDQAPSDTDGRESRRLRPVS